MTNKHLFAAILATSALASTATPSMASASGGTYTQFLCANPDTGAQGIGLPEGLTYVSSTPNWQATNGSACGVLTPKLDGAVQDGDYAAIHYEVTDPKLSIESAEHYGALTGHAGSGGFLTLRQHGSTVVSDMVTPSGTDQGIWADGGHIDHGLTDPPFASANRHVTQVGQRARFTIMMACDTGFASTSCVDQAADWRYTLFAARITLRDGAAPSASAVSGTLQTATSLRGVGVASFSAADQGSGLYRWRLYGDAHVIDQGVLGVDADCRDINPTNGDDYEFAGQHPCPTSALGVEVKASVAALSEGAHPIRLAIEDAAGNETTVVTRVVTIDNVPDPALISDPYLPPAITGMPRIGEALTGEAGSWHDTTTIAYAWERCDTNDVCTAISGATSPSYTPTAADASRRLRLAVTGTNRANESRTERSAMTAAVPAATTPQTPTSPAADPAVKTTTLDASPTPPDLGKPAVSAAGRLTVSLGRATSRRVRFAATTTATGRLTDASGAPIPGATIAVGVVESRPGAPRRLIGHTTTTAAGTFTYAIGHGPSRAVTFTYNTSAATVRLIVPAKLTLRIGKASTRRTTWLTGHIDYLRRAGIKLEVQALDGKRWRTFDTTKTKKGGSYRYGYRFKPSAAGRRFALRVLVDSPLYPFARAASKPATVRVTR